MANKKDARSLSEKLASVRKACEEAGQAHLLKYVDAGVTTEAETEALLDQISALDLHELNRVFAEVTGPSSSEKASSGPLSFEPIKDVASTTSSSPEDLQAWEARGLDAIREGRVAAIVLSGGQGTRLGFDGPKGMYKIGLPSGKSIFQLMAERIIRLSELAGAERHIPFYVMTSPLNDQTTRRFFSDHGNFGLRDVVFFEQGTMPCFGLDGQILLDTPGSLAVAPDGNGSIYPSLRRSGALADMEKRGVQYVHVFSVDNVLVKVADPVFIGYCLATGADCGNKVVWKSHAAEKVGVVVRRDGRPAVVEYSEMGDEVKARCDAAGRLVFGAGNICNHFFTLDFIRDTVLANLHSLYHAARKKIPCVTFPETLANKPDKENGIKLEAFICDVFPLSARMALLDVPRRDEFAPVKDAPGGSGDTPEAAVRLLSEECKRWVEAAGGKLQPATDKDGQDASASTCEISPLVSYRGEGLEARVKGKAVPLPFCF